MINFQDGKGNTISEATKCMMVTHHNRLFINPGLGLPLTEGSEVIVFTEENLDKIWDYHNKEMKEALQKTLDTQKELVELIQLNKRNIGRIVELEEEVDKLTQLNTKLTTTIMAVNEG